MGKAENKMEKIVVVVRVRPLHKEEASQRSPWKLSSKSVASSKTCRPSVPCHSFTYDRVYGTKGTTLEIYEAHVKHVISSAISGVNGTVIAYGQPGSGKTFTMRGSPDECGILVLAVQDVFKRVQEAENREFLIRVSYYEVANEKLIDLLASKNQRLDVHEDAQGGVLLAGLREEIVVGAEQVLSLLNFADARNFVGSTNISNGRRRPHSIFSMVIESRLDNQGNLLISQATDAVQVSVLNLVEVSAMDSAVVEHDGSSLEQTKPDKSLITLDKVMSKLSAGADKLGGSLPYSESKLTHLLKPSFGGNTRTCFICHISPAMVHLDGTVATLMFAAKATKVMNCLNANKIFRDKSLLKRQRREIEELQNKLTGRHNNKGDHLQDLEEVVNRRNALFMIELERDQMSIELLGKAPLVCWSEREVNDQLQKGENLVPERESGFHKSIELGDFNSSSQKKTLHDYSDDLDQFHKLEDVDHLSRRDSDGLSFSPHAGSKRKKTSSTDIVAEKFSQVDLLVPSKMAQELDNVKADGIAEGQKLRELRALIEQQDTEKQELLAQKDDECRNLQQMIAQLEKEKVAMEKRLQEQENTFSVAVESLQGQLAAERARQVHRELPDLHSCDALKSIHPGEGEQGSATASQNEANFRSVANLQGELQERGLEFLESLVKQHTEAQSCISHESEEQQNLLKGMEGQHTPTKRKSGHSKANKVFQKYQTFQGRAEISSLRKEMAVAKETISALKDERDGLWRDLKQIKSDESEHRTEQMANMSMDEEDRKGDNNIQQLLAAAVDELKIDLESTVSITDALLELVLESFQILTDDLKSFQEGVAELKVLSCATTDLSESLEKGKLQLIALRHGKLASENELHSMKSELAKLECVVERQSGILKVLSDNESLLSELSSVKAAMKDAAGASEARLLSIQQEYSTKLEKLEFECENWKQEHLQLEEKCTNIQLQLDSAQAEVQSLTQVLEAKSELEKKQTDTQLKIVTAEVEVLRLTQALEKSKLEKKHKYSRSRQATTEAEIVRLTNSLGEKGGLQEEIKRLQAELALSRTEAEELEREVQEKDKSHQECLSKLANTEDTVARITVAWEDKVMVEAEQRHKVLCTEKEVVKLSKLLEDTLSQMKAQQRELIISRGKVENLAKELEEMNKLENNYSTTLDRLVESETEVARLTKTIATQLEDKCILEQDHTNVLYKLENSEIEVVRMTESLTAVQKEKEKVEKELKRIFLELSKSESHVERLSETLTREKGERKLLGDTHQEALDKLTKEQDHRKRLEKSNLELLCKLTKGQKEKGILKETHQEMLEMLNRDHLEKKHLEKSNREDLVRPSGEQEEEPLEKKHQKVLDEFASLESKVMQLTEILAEEVKERSRLEKEKQEIYDQLTKEKLERSTLEEKTVETLYQIAKEQDERKELEKAQKNILDTLTSSQLELARLTDMLATQQQDKNKLEMEHQQIFDSYIRQQEERDTLEKRNQEVLHKLEREQEERKQLEKTHQSMLDNHSASQSKLVQLTETLTGKLERQGFKKDHQETFDCLTRQQEERNALEKENQEILHKLIREQDKREQLEKTHQSIVDELAKSQSQVVQLTENMIIEMQESNKLEMKHLAILNKLTIEQERISEEASHKLNRGEEWREVFEKAHQSVFQNHDNSEAQVAQLAETFTGALQEKGRMETGNQENLDDLSREQEDKRALERNSQKTLQKLKKEQEERRELLERAHHAILQNLGGSEAHVVQLMETLSRELQEKKKLESDHQDVLNDLNREQEERRALEMNNQNILDKLTRALEKRDVLEKTHQNTLDELSGSEAKIAELTEALSTELQEKSRLEKRHQEVLENLTREQEENIIEMNKKEIHQLSSGKEHVELLEKNNQSFRDQIADLEGKVTELTGMLAAEVQKKNELELEYRKIVSNIESMKSDAAKLTEILAKELESRNNLDRQLAISNAEVARVTTKLSQEAAEKENLMSNYSLTLTKLAASEMEVENLTKMLEATSHLQEELQNLQLTLADLEAKLVRQTVELGESREEELRLLQVDLDATTAAFKSLSSQKEKLHQENTDLLTKVSSSEAEMIRLNDELGDKLRLEEEHRGVQVIVANLQSEIVNLTNALAEKSRLEEEQKKAQLDHLSHKGEISKLTKELRVNRKVVKEQKKLIHKITSTQAEVLKLTNALGGRSDSRRLQVEQNTATDSTVTGIPCEHCGLPAFGEENIQLQQNIESTEAEVVRLSLIEEKGYLEKKCANVQVQLSMAEVEIERLTTALEDKSNLEGHIKRFQLNLSEAGLLRSGKHINGFQSSIEELPTELLQMERELVEQNKELQSKAAELLEKEQCLRDKEIGSDVDYEALNTIITLREKERDALREQCVVVESKLLNLTAEVEKQRELESAEKKLKSRCHKAERDSADLRAKLEKLEKAVRWLVRDKGVIEERLACCEVQLTAAREASRSANKELELSHHQLHVLRTQHQSEMTALCDELSLKKVQKAELEKELKRLLGHPHQHVRPLQESPGFLPSPQFRLPQWPYSKGPGQHFDTSWGDGKR